MIRIILITALAFIIPFIVWTIAARMRGIEGPAPLGWLSAAGAVTALITLTALALLSTGETERGEGHTPPRIERTPTPPGHLGPRQREEDPGEPSDPPR
ncbi:MAG: hypothetical protein JJU18_01650 [Oceanicaulis sp.]|nr:hypothetical protein [Oceanicaulis sp.]